MNLIVFCSMICAMGSASVHFVKLFVATTANIVCPLLVGIGPMMLCPTEQISHGLLIVVSYSEGR